MKLMGSQGASIDEIEEVYRRRLDVFVQVATAVLADREGARDAVHDGFARAVVKRRTFRREGSLEGWLWRFVLHAAQDAREPPAPVRVGEDAERRNGYEPSEVDRIRRAVAALPDRQREIVFLRYYADLDYSAIADAVGVSSGTVGAALNSAHTSLRRRLEEGDT
ncbi:MAG TPA: sigma-70 family RNA polymerase sigma factor [Gaiellaceae bacterium]|jgi:RNA polymerase sigma factor (sigma-70 family)|nr:sigma-70 family RNA polymerase sigma factor [Gaiellaceae bacterium]